MGHSKPSKWTNPVTAAECGDFLLAVANAGDRAASPGTRARFEKLYRSWFPKDMNVDDDLGARALRALLFAYSIPHIWKCQISRVEEKPETEFQLNVAILRDRLRYLWASTLEQRIIRRELMALEDDIIKHRRGGNTLAPPGVVDWRVRSLAALGWLERNFHRLRICLNRECKETRYFVRKGNNQRYCCATCYEKGEELKRREKMRRSEPKRILSEEARAAISHAQKKRWRKYRAEKKRLKKQGLVESRIQTGYR